MWCLHKLILESGKFIELYYIFNAPTMKKVSMTIDYSNKCQFEWVCPQASIGFVLAINPSSLRIENSLSFGVNEIISSQKLVGNLDKMTIANLGRQHPRYLDSYFKSTWEYWYLFGVWSYYFIPSILLNIIVYILKLILLMFSHPLNNTTTSRHLSYQWEDDTSIIRLLCVSQTCHTKEGEHYQIHVDEINACSNMPTLFIQ